MRYVVIAHAHAQAGAGCTVHQAVFSVSLLARSITALTAGSDLQLHARLCTDLITPLQTTRRLLIPPKPTTPSLPRAGGDNDCLLIPPPRRAGQARSDRGLDNLDSDSDSDRHHTPRTSASIVPSLPVARPTSFESNPLYPRPSLRFAMPITLKPRPSLPSFTFSPPPSDADADASDSDQTTQVQVQVAQVAPPRPPADFIPERDMHMLGSRPLDSSEHGKALVKCARCGKVVMELAAVEHKRE
jgi:hypothetical protein